MCETRRNSRPVRDGPVAGADESAVPRAPRAPRQEQRRYKTSGDDSRAPGASAGDGEFTTVRRRKPQGARPPRKEKVVAESA